MPSLLPQCRLRPFAALSGRRVEAGVAAPTGVVYRLRMPLVGWEALERALGPFFPRELAVHEAVVVCTVGEGGCSLCVAYDFLPVQPAAPLTAAVLLTGGQVLGVARARPLCGGVPARRCERVGETAWADPHAAAREFQVNWSRDPSGLRLFRRDCRHHVQELESFLLHPPSSESEEQQAEG
jgi:hypothetical protein